MSWVQLVEAGVAIGLATLSAIIACVNLLYGTKPAVSFCIMLILSAVTWGVIVSIVFGGGR